MVAATIAISVMYFATVKLAAMVANATEAVMDAVMVAAVMAAAVVVAVIAVAVDATVVEAAERVKQRLLPSNYY